jgi:hypothetical protein
MPWSSNVTTGRVQDCGCIALPDDLQEKTGLYPGATYRIEISAEGYLVLVPLQTQPLAGPKPGARC